MKRTAAGLIAGLMLLAMNTALPSPTNAPNAQAIVDRAVASALERFQSAGLKSNDLAVTLVLLSDRPDQGSYRGQEKIYPASVIKLFYLVAAHRWMEDGRTADTPELRRALRDMIVESLNEATGYVIDLLTGTTSGPELSPAALEAWYEKRNAVNRYFASQGYRRVNANRKPWCEGPYGREMQSVKAHEPNHRNWLTTEETARLLVEIATLKSVSEQRSREMLELLHRDAGDKTEDQAFAYTRAGLPEGAQLWSKAGLTSQTRHDAAYVELASGRRFVLVTFTERNAGDREIIAMLARSVVSQL